MRRTGWSIPVIAIALWSAVILWPLVASVDIVINQPRTGIEIRNTAELMMVSGGWGLAVAIAAMLIGWAPGRWLGAAINRKGFGPLAVLMLVPICLPAYVVFYAWWQAWPADTAIFRWAVEHNRVQHVRHATLLVGLVCWSWPIVAWCVAGSAASTPAEREELLTLDGAGWITRALDRWRRDCRGLLVGGLIVFVAAFNNTTCFDLAEIFSFGNELRAIEAMGASRRDVLSAAMPATLLTAAGAMAIWLLLGVRDMQMPTRTIRPFAGTLLFTAALWLFAVAVPLTLLGRNFMAGPFAGNLNAQLDQFWSFYGRGLINTIGIALTTAVLATLVSIGLAWMWQDRRWWVRLLAHGQAIGWIVAAAVPGTLYGASLSSAYNRGTLAETVFAQPTILVLGYLGRLAFIGALLGRWIAMREPHALRDLRAMDGAERFLGLVRTTWPGLLAAGGATFGVVLVLSLSEIPVTAMVRPPGFDLITPSILNDMHFQRPQTVMIAAGIYLLLAILAASVTIGAWWVMRSMTKREAAGGRAGVIGAVVVMTAISMPGCGASDPENAPPLNTQKMFGSAGRGLGQFYYPRAMAIDWKNEYIFIVDRSSRIQRFSLDGEPQLSWRMPDSEKGFPTGLTVGPDGLLYVADTHYFRVLVFDAEGRLVDTFGEYGMDAGEFIYTTDVAIGPKARIYVSETGGNDRIQVFNAEGEYLFEFGSFGSGEGRFNRPQSLMFNADRTELFIADAVNHRIVVTDPEGNWLRTIGAPGRGLGEFSYPYSVHVYDDGSLLVVEFHNCRIQKIAPDGRPAGLWGRVGFRQGELQFPWTASGNERVTYVLDSGNNRVQVIRTP